MEFVVERFKQPKGFMDCYKLIQLCHASLQLALDSARFEFTLKMRLNRI